MNKDNKAPASVSGNPSPARKPLGAQKRPAPAQKPNALAQNPSRRPSNNPQRPVGSKVPRPASAKAPLPKAKAPKKLTKEQKAEQKRRSNEEFKAKIKTQSPSQRQAARSSKRINGSVKNLEIKRHAGTRREKFRIKKKKTPMKRIIILGIVIFFVILGVLFGMLALYVNHSLKSGSSVESESYSLQIGAVAEEDNSNVMSISKINGQIYIPVSALSEMCSLTVTGVSDDLRYIVRDDDSQIIRFIVGSDLAYVNSCKVRMKGESYISDGKLYVPLDFFMQYSEGLAITVDDNEALVTISRTVVDKDEYLNDIYADFRFKLSPLEPLSAIPVLEDVYTETQETEETDETDSIN